ncbi:MAG: MMPL family transporter [Nanoarchaeota archaeon]|nr:MMPL family transporter [Nanoarchaeota archaeon]
MAKKLNHILKKIAHFQVVHPFFTILVLIMLTLIIWGGISKVQTIASLENMMPKITPEIKAFNDLRDNHLGQDMIIIVVEIDRDSSLIHGINDVRDYDIYQYLSKIEDELKKETEVIGIYSYASGILFYSNKSNFEEIDKIYYKNLIVNEDFKKYVSNFVNDDYSRTMLIINSDIASNDLAMDLFSSKVKSIVSDIGKPAGIKIKFTGTPIIQQRLGELINKDRADTQWIAIIFVFTITMLIFRSLLSALVPIIVVFVSVNWLYGIMGYSNLPISTLAGGVAAMVIGIGIDFAIHIMNKFKYERKLGNSIKNSIELAVTETGTALVATSMTTMVAFLAFLFGVMPEMGRFGILMAIGIFFSLVFSLFGLPALLIIEEKIIYYIKKTWKFGIDKEFHLVEEKQK